MTWTESPLDTLLNPISQQDFQQDYFGQKHLYIPGLQDAPKQAEKLFNWKALNKLLNKGSGQLNLRIVQDSLNYLIQKDGANLKEILYKLRKGGTLVLEGIDQRDDKLACFCDALSAEIGAKTRINLYLSCPDKAGYPLHYDTHDFFIIQVYGHKKWEIFPQTIQDPLLPAKSFSSPHHSSHKADQSPPDESQRLTEFVINPGDVLYVPKGYWHRAMAQIEPSLHLTVGLYMPTGMDLMHWLLDRLKDKAGFRKSFPLSFKHDLPQNSHDPSPYEDALNKLKNELFQELNQKDLLSQYHQDHWASMEHRQSFSLPHQYAQSSQDIQTTQSFSVRKAPYYLMDFDDGHLELVFQNQKLNFTVQARELLVYMLDLKHFTRADLQEKFPEYPWPVLQAVLLPLIQDGMIIPEEES